MERSNSTASHRFGQVTPSLCPDLPDGSPSRSLAPSGLCVVHHHPGADDRIRTGDLLITSELLYQLSYIGGYLVGRAGFEPAKA